jgi:hypothetical protein
MTENLKSVFYQAPDEFVANESSLLTVDKNKRTISSKFAPYHRGRKIGYLRSNGSIE